MVVVTVGPEDEPKTFTVPAGAPSAPMTSTPGTSVVPPVAVWLMSAIASVSDGSFAAVSAVPLLASTVTPVARGGTCPARRLWPASSCGYSAAEAQSTLSRPPPSLITFNVSE